MFDREGRSSITGSQSVCTELRLAVLRLAPVQDVFSLGCVIAEVFLEGQRLFDLSEVRLHHCQPAHGSKLFQNACVPVSCVVAVSAPLLQK